MIDSGTWPTDIALRDAVDWIAQRLDAAKLNGKLYRAYCYGDVKPSSAWVSNQYGEHSANEPSARTMRELQERSGSPWVTKPKSFDISHEPNGTLITGEQFAWIYSQAWAVDQDRRRPTIRLSASRESHGVMHMLVAPWNGDKSTGPWEHVKVTSDSAVLYWAGKREPLQLHLLGDEAETVDAAIAHSLIRNLGSDALRDWIGLHQLAGEQGATGDFMWSWAEYRERAGYAAQIRKSTNREADLARAARARLYHLSRAQLWSETEIDDGSEKKLRRVQIGAPYGLINIGAEILKGDHRTPEVLAGRINPALYLPVSTKTPFTQLPFDVTRLPIEELRLFTMLAFCWRAGKGDAVGHAQLRARTLWGYAGFSKERWKDRRRWPALRVALERALRALSDKHNIDWSDGGAEPTAVYTIRAPAWWRDRMRHGVKAELPPSTAHVPRTAGELESARKAHGLSMRQLAAVLEIGHGTVGRWAEKAVDAAKESEPLPGEWVQRLAAAKLWKS